MNLRDNESYLNLWDPLIYLIYNRSRAGEFDALHQCFLVHSVFKNQPESGIKHYIDIWW